LLEKEENIKFNDHNFFEIQFANMLSDREKFYEIIKGETSRLIPPNYGIYIKQTIIIRKNINKKSK